MFKSKFIQLKPLQQTLPACLSDSGLLLPNTAFTAKAASPMLALYNVIKHIVYKIRLYPHILSTNSFFTVSLQTVVRYGLKIHVFSSAIPYSLHRHEDFSTRLRLLKELGCPNIMRPQV